MFCNLTETAALIKVKQQTEHDPDEQHEIALAAKMDARKARNGNELKHHEDAGENSAKDRAEPERGSAILSDVHSPECGNTSGKIAN